MKLQKTVRMLATVAGLFAGCSALAMPGRDLKEPWLEDETASAMREGAAELAPMPFVMFCMDYPDECRTGTSSAVVDLTDEKFDELRAINQRVNARIRPTADYSVRRIWRLGVSRGDCNAYAVQKRHELIASGWPANALLLTVAKTSWGEGHLLVVVRTDRGEYVLDSLTNQIRLWNRTNYKWVMRQSSDDPTAWVSLNEVNKPAAPKPDWVDEAAVRLEYVASSRPSRRETRTWAPIRGVPSSSYDIGL